MNSRWLLCGAFATLSMASGCYTAREPATPNGRDTTRIDDSDADGIEDVNDLTAGDGTEAYAEGVPATVVIAPLTASAEPDNFALYSYLLYRTRPSSNAVDQAIFAELLRHPFASSIVHASHSNLTLIPTSAQPNNRGTTPQWWIEHYDIDHARDILAMQQIEGDGPFIVTHRNRLGFATLKHPGATIIDLSGVRTPESGTAWVRHFVDASEQPDHWATNNAEFVFLKVADWAGEFGLVVQSVPGGNKLLKALGGG